MHPITGGKVMTATPELLAGLREKLNYSDAEWEMWLNNPRNLNVVERFAQCGNLRLVAEVIKSRGCAAGHKVGDKLIFSAMGAFVGKEPPGEVCTGVLAPLIYSVSSVWSSIAGGVDPQDLLLFNTFRCLDVGVDNGGWGEVVMQLRLEKV